MHPLIPKPLDLPSIGGPCDPRRIRYYGCTICQCHHAEGAPEFVPHLFWQDKHGLKTMGREAYFRLVCRSN